jgi:hypothetical protein
LRGVGLNAAGRATEWKNWASERGLREINSFSPDGTSEILLKHRTVLIDHEGHDARIAYSDG